MAVQRSTGVQLRQQIVESTPELSILLLATITRFFAIQQQVWGDEGNTIMFVRKWSYTQLLFELPTRQPHWPPYYVLVRSWMDLTGLAPISARFFSALAGIGTVALTIYLGRHWWNERTGRIAGLLLAVSPVMIIQSGWLRMYALFTLLTTASWYALTHARNADRWWGWGGCAIATVWTHPYGLLVLGSQVTYLALVDRPDKHWRRWRRRLRAIAVVSLTALPTVWLLTLKVQDKAGTARLHHLTTPPGIVEVLALPTALLVGRIHLDAQLISIGAVTLALALSVGVALRGDRAARLCWWWLAAPAGGAVLASYGVRPIWQLKYLVGAAPAVALLTAVGGSYLPRRGRRLLIGTVVATQLFVLVTVGNRTPWLAIHVLG